MPLMDRVLGQNFMEDVEKKVNVVKESLVPIMEQLIIEQKKANKTLSDILDELKVIRRKK